MPAFWQGHTAEEEPAPVFYGQEPAILGPLENGRWHVTLKGTVYFDEANPEVDSLSGCLVSGTPDSPLSSTAT